MKLKGYIQGKRQGKAANKLEREALNDPFLQDAIDGFDSVNDNHWHAIENLEERLSQRIKTKENSGNNRHWLIGIAASIALLIGFGSLVYFNLHNGSKKSAIAKLEEAENSWDYPAEKELSETARLSDSASVIAALTPPPPQVEVVQNALSITDDDVETSAPFIESEEQVLSMDAIVMENEEDAAFAFELKSSEKKAQPEEETYDKEIPETKMLSDGTVVYLHPDTIASFPGGEKEMIKFISKNLKYPANAMESSIQGTVYIRMVIRESGEITDIEVMRSVHKLLDDEAIKVVRLMPNFIPTKVKGKNVASYFILPVRFTLE